MIKKKIMKGLNLIAQFSIICIYIVLFISVASDLSNYDVVYSGGTDDARWFEDGTLDEYDIYDLIFWGTYLFTTLTHILLYFWQPLRADRKYYWWTLPTFNIGSFNIICIAISFLLSSAFLAIVTWLNITMPEVFMPSLTLGDMKELHYGYPGIDSFEASLIKLCWFMVTIFSTLHLLIYGIISLVRKHRKDKSTQPDETM